MERLFCIDTERVLLTWTARKARVVRRAPEGMNGWLRLTALRRGLGFREETWRAGVAPEVAFDAARTDGPLLFEEADYEVYARSRGDEPVSLHHDDPLVESAIRAEEGGRVLHGLVNFGAQIGRSAFTLRVGGAPEVAFEVEVFPSKLDYMEDYRQILAEVQGIATGLALTYLSATRQRGEKVAAGRPSDLEWTRILADVVDQLERAIRHVAERPLRGLAREEARTRAERVSRADATIRAAVRRGRGEGPVVELPGVGPVRARLPARRPTPSLDTPEHRWLAAQLAGIRRRLAEIRRAVAKEAATLRRRRALADLDRLEARIAALVRLEPIDVAGGEPPPGFASLRLLGAPGYREAYGACVALSRGLEVTGGPLDLSVKGLDELYEIYCFLAAIRAVARIPGVTLDLREVFQVRSRGLTVTLRRGREAAVRARGPLGRTITLAYNPLILHPHLPTAQRPDLLVTVEDRGWPKLHLVLDAKYRLDDSPEHVARYDTPGPPDDALNVLHRYRDAILERREEGPPPPPGLPPERAKRAVVQAAAAFPYRPPPEEDFSQSKLYRALAEVGVGAIPVLPEGTDLLSRWLLGALLGGPWALSDTAINHESAERAHDWRRAASELVLIGTLREQNPAEHLAWVARSLTYYTPFTSRQERQLVARWIGLYTPARMRGGEGAVTHLAEVISVEVKPRGEIHPGWPATRPEDELMLVFHLRRVEAKERPIVNADGRRVPTRTWSSRLAVDRAEVLGQLSLETEPEWRLYERLVLHGAPFRVEAGPARLPDPKDPRGRARFHGEGWEVRYVGTKGFQLRRAGIRKAVWFDDAGAVVAALMG